MATMLVRHRRSITPAVRRSSRRRLQWSTNRSEGVTVGPNDTALIPLLGELTTESTGAPGVTIMRTHLYCHPDTAAGSWTIGLLVTRSNDTGLTVDPTRFPGLDWLLLTEHSATYSGATPDAITPVRFDVRAKRKITDLQLGYSLVVQNHHGATESKNFRFHSRVLVAYM